MPRVNGVFQLPPGVYGVAGAPIQSVPYNTVLDDFTADANTPRPIGAGGTGSSSPAAARVALGVPSLTGDEFTGVVTMTGLNLKTAANRVIAFMDEGGGTRGLLFQEAGNNDLVMQKTTGETLRISAARMSYTGDFSARDGQFSRGNGEGYIYFAGTDTRYIGFDGTRYVFNIAGVAIDGASTIGGVAILTAAEISASRARHITTNGLDNFIVALIDAAGSSIPTIGADYAGSVFYDAAGGGALSYTGTWRCLSRVSAAAPYAGLFYKFA